MCVLCYRVFLCFFACVFVFPTRGCLRTGRASKTSAEECLDLRLYLADYLCRVFGRKSNKPFLFAFTLHPTSVKTCLLNKHLVTL